jgi:hypothetical protein
MLAYRDISAAFGSYCFVYSKTVDWRKSSVRHSACFFFFFFFLRSFHSNHTLPWQIQQMAAIYTCCERKTSYRSCVLPFICLISTPSAVCPEIVIIFPCIIFYETVVLWGVTYGWIGRQRILWAHFTVVLCKNWETKMSTGERSVPGRGGGC